MGRHIDALLGRNTFRASKLKPVISLAISRLAIFKNQRQARSNIAQSDVVQLLNLGHHERAFLRINFSFFLKTNLLITYVLDINGFGSSKIFFAHEKWWLDRQVEQVIKEQNILEVFVMIEGYCHILNERAGLIEKEKVCPDELDEAMSSLIYAATNCGEFPELQKIHAILTSWFGNEFAARAIELSNKSGSNHKIVQMLSTRQPSLDKKLKVLKDIASENGISLENEERSFIITQEKLAVKQKSNQPKVEQQEKSSTINDNSLILPEHTETVENLSDSMKGRLYRDVADAAQEAFVSAAVAARAAVELSRAESVDLDDEEIHMTSTDNMFKQHKEVPEMKISVSDISSESSSDSAENIKNPTSSPNIHGQTIAFDPRDDEKDS